MKTIIDRLNDLMDETGDNPYTLGKKSGVDPNAVGRILNKKVKKPNIENLTSICDYFGVRESWFLTGEGEKYKPKDQILVNTIVRKILEKIGPTIDEIDTVKEKLDQVSDKIDYMFTEISGNKLEESMGQLKDTLKSKEKK